MLRCNPLCLAFDLLQNHNLIFIILNFLWSQCLSFQTPQNPYLCTWPCYFYYKKRPNLPRPTSGHSYLGILLHLLDNRWGGNYPVNMHLCHLLLKLTDTPFYFCPEEWIEIPWISLFLTTENMSTLTYQICFTFILWPARSMLAQQLSIATLLFTQR